MTDMAVAKGFCGRSNERGRGSSARFDMCAGSLDGLSERFGQADEVIGGHREGELRIDFEQSAMPHLTQADHRLGPAESFLDAFADALRERIAEFPCPVLCASATCSIGVASSLLATSDSAVDCCGVKPPSGKKGT